MKSANLFLNLIWFFVAVRITVAGFIKFGPCVLRWGTECPHPFIQFYLYTRKNKYGEKVSPSEDDIRRSHFDPALVNKIIIHGYNTDMTVPELVNIREGYLKSGGFNVWMVDWREIAVGPCYPIVVSNLDYVGKCVSDFIRELKKSSELPTYRFIHIIGFSLGAHLAAYAANYLRPLVLPRITGLDPALPLFIARDMNGKLDRTDAAFVDVIHTNAFMRGHYEPAGDVDFYVNGGIRQPGCRRNTLSDTSSCDHHRAPAYFAESILNNKRRFYGYKCETYLWYLLGLCSDEIPNTLMGEHCSQSSTGIYIVPLMETGSYMITVLRKHEMSDE